MSLALVYIELATHIGLTARGVSFPGHFLVKLRLPQGEVVIDPCTGQSLSRDELDDRLDPYRRRQGLIGDQAGRKWSHHHPRDQIADKRGNPEPMGNGSKDEGQAYADDERSNERRCFEHGAMLTACGPFANP